ncbi:hypothetical protein EVG59_13960 [Salmonella enterica subsp. enterica serovar Dortmund]|nr:hypothetical protein [Salmonella enterica subsp. enterica serovar Dortmund]ECB1960325.1 hypothetical protein [Salmonella enterica subsp. enterica serovar Dortmund]
MGMEERDHFDIVHCIFPFFIYYCLILYRKCKNQIYLHFFMIFLPIIKLIFEKIFISVLTHGYALKLTFCI